MPNNKMRKRINIKRFTFFLWVGLAFLLMGVVSNHVDHRDTFLKRELDDLWRVIYVTIVNYAFFEITLPLLSWRKFFASFFRLLVYFLLYSLGLCLWESIGIALSIYTSFATTTSQTKEITEQMTYSMGSVFFFGIIRHVYNYINLKRSAQQLRIEKQQAELSYLKSQTNPHFLFNTLNNIYSLARDKSDLAPESILRLSKMLRYMLYETGGAFIAIEQELKIISDYIALERLRYDESLRVNFNTDIEDMRQALPPLLLMPLVENAFKHGVSETRNQPYVDIHLSVNKRQLAFFVKNSTEDIPGDEKVRENIGLSNLRRQLELQYTDYSLELQHVGREFQAILKINLASHV